MEFLKNLLTEFDPAAFVPELTTVIGWLELIVRLCVLAGPIALLVMGLWFLILPPKEANHMAGYRFFWGMGSVQSWKLMQLIAGIAWTAVGLILTIVMVVITNGYRGMEPIAMAYNAVQCLLWQIGITGAVCLLIDASMMVMFDYKGNFRPWLSGKAAPKSNKPKKPAPKKENPTPKPKKENPSPKPQKPKVSQPKKTQKVKKS